MNRRLVTWLIATAVVGGVLYALLSPAPAVQKRIGSTELSQLQSQGAWLIDVRTNAEYVGGHLPNSLNIPVDQLGQKASGWSKNQPIILYCATGARSANAAALLASLGFRKVYDLENGIAAWTGEVVGGQATATTPGPTYVKTAGKPVFIDFAGSA